MTIVTIKEVKNVVTCTDKGTAEHVFNVKNATGKTIQISMQTAVSDAAASPWITIDGASDRELDADTITQVNVKIKVPSDCPPGRYGYRLRVFDPKNPGEHYTDGEMVFFDVPEKIPEPVKVPKKGKKFNWIPMAVAAGVLVLAGVLVVVLMTGGDKLPDFTQMDLKTAEAFLNENNIKYKKLFKISPRSSQEVLKQSPDADTKLKKVGKVILTIAGVEVPQLKNSTLYNALETIHRSGLTFNVEKGLHSRRIANRNQVGRIIQQKPAFNSTVVIKTDMELWVGIQRVQRISTLITNQELMRLKQLKSLSIPENFSTRLIAPEE